MLAERPAVVDRVARRVDGAAGLGLSCAVRAVTAPIAVASRAAAIVALVTSSCAAHVQLPAPPPGSAPSAVREAYWDAKRPVRVDKETTLSFSRSPLDFGLLGSRTTTTTLLLADGSAVAWPEDLLPAVDPASAAAEAIERSVTNSHVAEVAAGIGGGISAAGIVTMFAAPLAPGVAAQNNVLYVGAAALFAGLAAAPVLIVFGGAARAAKDDAFRAFSASLRERLALVANHAGGAADANPASDADVDPAKRRIEE